MANTLDFFMAMPKLCGAKNADRWAWIIEEVYLAELAGNTPFDKNEEDEKDFANRLEVAFAFKASDEGASPVQAVVRWRDGLKMTMAIGNGHATPDGFLTLPFGKRRSPFTA